MIKPNTLVKFDTFNEAFVEAYKDKYPFDIFGTFLFLGEIENLPGHCSIVEQKTGRIFVGYDIENFIELNRDEL